MIVDEMVEQALGRLGEFTNTFPSARGPMYRRIGYRQRQLYSIAGKINPERFGMCAISNLQTVGAARAIDLTDIVAPVFTPDSIQRVDISDHGTSPFANGDEVTIVGIEDLDAELPPRAIIRDRVLVGVGTDLDQVTTLKIYYSKLPVLIDLTGGNVALELEAPWDTLLEVDLAKWLLMKATQIAADVRAAGIESFKVEEEGLLADFKAHVADYGPVVSRFAQPRVIGG